MTTQALNNQNAIVDKDGIPNDYFIQLLQQRGLITNNSASAIKELMQREIATGFGLSGGGNLSANRTISLGNPALTDPEADRLLFWDESDNRIDWLTLGSNLSITDKTISASGGGTTDVLMLSNNATQDFTAATWVKLTVNTVVYNAITGSSLASNDVTLPAGTYLIEGRASAIRSNEARLKLRNETDAADICSGMAVWGGSATGTGVGAFVAPTLFGTFTITSSKVVAIYVRVSASTSAFTDNGALGDPGSLGYNSATCEFKFTKIA